MREYPIICPGPTIPLILSGCRTQMRHVIKPQPSIVSDPEDSNYGQLLWPRKKGDERFTDGTAKPWRTEPPPWPYEVGDVLWVRETWQTVLGFRPDPRNAIRYKIDDVTRAHADTMEPARCQIFGNKWRSSSHMPRWASRITLRVLWIRLQRLQDISEAEARLEGWDFDDGPPPDGYTEESRPTARFEFQFFWDAHNPRYPWRSNPWVRVTEFEVQ